ncbi:translocation/assembly module TamB [Cecembia rubra]|uniref:translocation/assembly module TamB domain-containing protein n=1 Tax=Cecembia rubra TaxID=1485585 RepID=UPI002714DC62|nr:translocation/assembly module TamB [Cecembia rubra]
MIKQFIIKFFKISGITLAVFFLLVMGVFLFIRSPWGQDIIVKKSVNILSRKAQTEIQIEKLFFTFKGNLFVKGLYLEDQKGDTLIYSQSLETGLSLKSLIMGNGIEVSKVKWEGLKANVKRDSVNGVFNYDFLIQAFVGEEDKIPEPAVEKSPLPNIRLGPIELNDFAFYYDDQILGIRTKAAWESLSLKTNSIDLNAMDFDIANLDIKNSKIDYFQYKALLPPEEEPVTEGPLPLLVLDQLNIEGTDWAYQSLPDGIKAKIQWSDFRLSLPEADLDAQKILMKYMSLKDANIEVEMTAFEAANVDHENQESPPSQFEFPDWWIEVGNIDLVNNRVFFSADGQESKVGVFNPDALEIEYLNFSAHALSLYDNKLKIVLDQINIKEKSGLELESLKGSFELEENRLSIKNFQAQTPHTLLETNLALSFLDLNDLIQNPENSNLELNLITFQTNASEALYFQPELKKDQYFVELMRKGISLKGKVEGSINRLQIPQFQLKYGQQTRVEFEKAVFSDILTSDRLQFDVPQFRFASKKSDLKPFIKDFDLSLPDSFVIDFNTRGSINNIVADLKFISTDGDIYSKIEFSNTGVYEVLTELSLSQLDLGKILEVEELQPVTMHTLIEGKGSSPYDLLGNMALTFEQLSWKGLDFSALKVLLTAKDTMVNANVELDNEFLDFVFHANASLDSLNPALDFSLDLKNLQTYDLGFTKQDIQAKMMVFGKVNGVLNDLRASVDLEDAVLLYQKKPYPLGKFQIKGRLADFLTEMSIQSDFFWGDFRANASLDDFVASILDYFDYHFQLDREDSAMVNESIEANGKFSFHPTPFIDQLLVTGLEDMDTLRFEFGFDSKMGALEAFLTLPLAQYNQAELDGFYIQVKGNSESLEFDTGFKGIQIDPLNMGETFVSGKFKQSQVNLDFFSKDEEGVLMDVKSLLVIESDSLIYSIIPEGLIFNRKPWEIPDSNRLVFSPELLAFDDFSFHRNGQSISFSNQISGIEQEHAGVVMREFELNTFFEFLNPGESLLEGKANGELVLINPFGALGLMADLRIDGVQALDIPLGNLLLNAEAETLQRYNFLLAIKEGMVDLDLKGKFYADSTSSVLDMSLALNSLEMAILDKFTGGEVREGKGFISGKIDLKGTVQEPVYEGNLVFNEASFLISQLNNRFFMNKEFIEIDNSGLTFNRFTIRDGDQHEFLIDGKILTSSFSDIGFDLNLNSKDFTVLNSTRADNDLFFGKANVDLGMTIKGTLELPEIDLRLKVNRGTNVTFIVPEGQLEMIERTGVVIFVNQKDPYDIMYQREGEMTTQGLTGYDLKANLKVDPQTVFNLIVDERTNDNLRLQGEADLNMLMDPNGNISLSGRYEVSSGHYELNLFGLVNRRFEISEGSFVSWNGDPLDANLNLVAIYNVRTSAAELMQAQISGIDNESRGQFRQVLPFKVFLKVGGEIIQPEISFELDMPEQDRGAFGGTVYSMLQQVNDKEDELTKQVFSLLVLNQFFPMAGNDGSTGGSVNLARSSVSQVLSSQLNALSDKIFGKTGFSLAMDLDSYTDFQSGDPQDRTQLNVAARQSLMDDRLVISVGGQMDMDGGNQNVNQGDALFGDVSIEYLLDTRGQWRAKAYRRNQFESIIDGQLIVTGISFIFNKEFNAFRELFIPLRKLEAIPAKEENKESVNENGGN